MMDAVDLEEKHAKARVFFEMGRLNEAINILRELIVEDPGNHPRYAPVLVDALIRVKKYDEASNVLEKLIARHPEDFENHFKKVELLIERDLLSEARLEIEALKSTERFRADAKRLLLLEREIEQQAIDHLIKIDRAVYDKRKKGYKFKKELENCISALLGFKVRHRTTRRIEGLGADFIFHDAEGYQYHFGITDNNIAYINRLREKANKKREVIPKGRGDFIFRYNIPKEKRNVKRFSLDFFKH